MTGVAAAGGMVVLVASAETSTIGVPVDIVDDEAVLAGGGAADAGRDNAGGTNFTGTFRGARAFAGGIAGRWEVSRGRAGVTTRGGSTSFAVETSSEMDS